MEMGQKQPYTVCWVQWTAFVPAQTNHTNNKASLNANPSWVCFPWTKSVRYETNLLSTYFLNSWSPFCPASVIVVLFINRCMFVLFLHAISKQHFGLFSVPLSIVTSVEPLEADWDQTSLLWSAPEISCAFNKTNFMRKLELENSRNELELTRVPTPPGNFSGSFHVTEIAWDKVSCSNWNDVYVIFSSVRIRQLWLLMSQAEIDSFPQRSGEGQPLVEWGSARTGGATEGRWRLACWGSSLIKGTALRHKQSSVSHTKLTHCDTSASEHSPKALKIATVPFLAVCLLEWCFTGGRRWSTAHALNLVPAGLTSFWQSVRCPLKIHKHDTYMGIWMG